MFGRRLINTQQGGGCTTDTLQILGDTSCIATYRLNGDATDLSGNYNGTATNVTYVSGLFGDAGSFNGSSSEVTVSSNALNINTISLSAWIKLSSLSGYQQIISNYSTDNKGWGFRINDGGRLAYTTEVGVIIGTTVLSIETWYNVVCTVSSSDNSTKLYINGSLDGSTTYTASLYGASNTNFHIGSFGNVDVQYLNGSIDQVRIFDRAITSTEVTTLYNEVAC